jgi:hypothetical protein
MSDTHSLFTSHAGTPVKASRFTLQGVFAPSREEGGRIALARDPNKVPYLVHQLARSVDAIPVHCVVTALQAEAIPLADVVQVYSDAGKLDALLAAATAAKNPPKAPASASK